MRFRVKMKLFRSVLHYNDLSEMYSADHLVRDREKSSVWSFLARTYKPLTTDCRQNYLSTACRQQMCIRHSQGSSPRIVSSVYLSRYKSEMHFPVRLYVFSRCIFFRFSVCFVQRNNNTIHKIRIISIKCDSRCFH